MESTSYSCQILMKLLTKQIFEKYSNTKTSYFVKILSGGAEFFYADGRTDRQTDRHGEADCRFSLFCEGT